LLNKLKQSCDRGENFDALENGKYFVSNGDMTYACLTVHPGR